MHTRFSIFVLTISILGCVNAFGQETPEIGSTCQGHDHDPDITVYTRVDHMPLFRGCDPQEENAEVCSLKEQALFIYSQMRYPAEQLSQGIGGECALSAVISPVGEVTQVRIKESTNVPALDREAIRIVEAMPPWHPGIHQHQMVFVEVDIRMVFEPKMHKRN